MCEHSGLSSLAALREARRRKILENSVNRLKLIQGINLPAEKQCVEKCLEQPPKLEIQTPGCTLLSSEQNKPDINPKLNEILNENKELKEISGFIFEGDKSLNEDREDEAEVISFAQNRGKTFSEIFLNKKLHYILLAIVVNIMLLFNVGHLFYENIFCPFYSVKLVEVLLKKETDQLQPVLLWFIAGLPKKLQTVTKVTLCVFSILLSDLCLYLFTFIIGNKLATSLR